jgi:hypothetical protein
MLTVARQFVEVAGNFPEECCYVLEMLGQVYGYDPEAREQAMTPVPRLQFHQQRSGPGDRATASVAGDAVIGTQNGTELRAGQGDHVSAAALEGAVFERSRLLPISTRPGVTFSVRSSSWTLISPERGITTTYSS